MNKKQLDSQLTIKLSKKDRIEIQKIGRYMNMPESEVARNGIRNLIAYRKRFKDGRYACRGNTKRSI